MYAMAHDYVYGSKIEQGVIMVCTPDLYYQEFKTEGANLRAWKHKALKRIDMYNELIHDEKERWHSYNEEMEMNEMLFRTLLKRYEANIEDALYKIKSFNENNIIIPEHIDITGEVDKLLLIIAEAEDKVAVMRKYYVKNKADKQVL